MPRENISPEAEAIRTALEHVGIAVGSLNPDPTQTIAEHQARQARQDRRSRWSLIIAIVAVVFSAASVAAAWIVPRIAPVATQKSPAPAAGAGTWVLWIGASMDGGPVIGWMNAVFGFDERAKCIEALKETDKLGLPQALQRRGVKWTFMSFPGETHPNGKGS